MRMSPFVLMMALVFPTSDVRAADPTELGPPLLVEATPGSAYPAQVAVDPAGNFLVIWEDYGTYARARAFWATGNPRGATFPVSGPSFNLGGSFTQDELVSVAADGAGNFVMAYNGYAYPSGVPACTGYDCIKTRRYDANGILAPASFVVGDPRLFSYEKPRNQTGNPELTADGQGGFVIAWEGYDLSPSGFVDSEGVWARKLVNGGQSNGSQFRVNANTDGYQGDAGALDIAADADGNFVVVFSDENMTESPYGGVVFRRFDSSKNPVGFQTQVTADGGYDDDPHVARTPGGGFMVVWEADSGGVGGRVYDAAGDPLTSEFEVAPSGYNPDVAASGAETFIVVFDVPSAEDESRGVVFDATGTPTSTEFSIGASLPEYRYRPSVGADQEGNFVVAWASENSVYAQRFQVTAPSPLEIPLTGKVLVVTNKDPENFEKSKGSWKASGAAITSPLRGSANDPRCNGDPDGTVKATARFLSATSGQDVSFNLPCQHWTTTGSSKVGSVEKRGYKYKDSKRVDGPCSSVKIKGTKSLSVSCKGKPEAAAFGYDLVSGVSQGTVTVVLETGLVKHCAEFQPLFDGSDGKKYKGKAFSAPASCPL